jgi:hypothetical protein
MNTHHWRFYRRNCLCTGESQGLIKVERDVCVNDINPFHSRPLWEESPVILFPYGEDYGEDI